MKWLLALLAALVTACSPSAQTVSAQPDAARIVSLNGGITETLFAMDLGTAVVGRDVSSDFPGTEDIPVVTQGHDVSAEGVLALQPTLVLGDAQAGPPEALDAIRAAGVPVVVVPEVWSLEEMPARAQAIADAVGQPDAARDLAIDPARIPRIKGDPVVAFLYLRGNAAVYLLGGDGSGADSLLEAVGAVDAGSRSGLGAFTPLTPEALAQAQPDALLVMEKGLESVGGIDGLLALPGVAQTPAAENRDVIVIPDGELLNFGPRTQQTLQKLAEHLS